MKNRPTNVRDCDRAVQIYDSNVPSIRGKTTKVQLTHVTVPVILLAPPSILIARMKRWKTTRHFQRPSHILSNFEPWI